MAQNITHTDPIESQTRGDEMNAFFDAITTTNRAYCAARGMSAGELYGTPPNVAELETHRLMAAGVSADPYFESVKADRLRLRKLVVKLQRKIRLRNIGYAPGRFKRMVNRENQIRSIK